jgi:hypothetical protein
MMRKSAWLLMLLFLSACSLPFNLVQADPTQASAAAAPVVPLAVEEAVPAPTCPAVCPEIPPVYVTCEPPPVQCADSVSDLVPVVTELAATIEAYNAAGLAAMPTLTETVSMQAGMPTLTATVNPAAGSAATATLEAMPPTPAPAGKYRAEAIIYKKNFVHPDKGCNWLGVAGQVLDTSGKPALDLVVVAEGVLQGQEILKVDITGLHNAYGPGGYELELGNQVLASSNMIYITVFDLAGNPLSSPVSIVTRADCNQNLLMLNFQQTP